MKWGRKKHEPAPEAAQVVQPVVVGHIELGLQLPNGATTKVIFYALQGQTREHISQNLDVFREILLRQRTIFEIPQIEEGIKAKRLQYEQVRKIQNDLGDRVRGGERLSSQEKLQFENAVPTLIAMEKDIREGEERLAQMRREVA